MVCFGSNFGCLAPGCAGSSPLSGLFTEVLVGVCWWVACIAHSVATSAGLLYKQPSPDGLVDLCSGLKAWAPQALLFVLAWALCVVGYGDRVILLMCVLIYAVLYKPGPPRPLLSVLTWAS